MHRSRSRQLVLAGLLTVIVLVAALWPLLEWGISRSLNAVLRGHVSWSRMRPAGEGLAFSDVTLVDSKGRPVVTAPRVLVRLGFWRMLRTRSVPRGIREVVIEHPRVLAQLRTGGRLNLTALYRPRASPPGHPAPFRALVRVEDGTVDWRDARMERAHGGGRASRAGLLVASATDVHGRLDLRGAPTASGWLPVSLRLEGQVTGAHVAVKVDAHDPLSDVRGRIDVVGLPVSSWAPYVMSFFPVVRNQPPLSFTAGRADTHLWFSASGLPKEWSRRWDGGGSLRLHGLCGSAGTARVAWSGGHLSARVGRLQWEVHDAGVCVGRDRLDVAGRVLLARTPQFDGWLSVHVADLGQTLRTLGEKVPVAIAGAVKADARLVGSLDAPFLQLHVRAPALRVGGRLLTGVRGALQGTFAAMHLYALRARLDGGRISATGWIFPGGHVLIGIRTRNACFRTGGALNPGSVASLDAALTVLGGSWKPLVMGSASARALAVRGLPVTSAAGNFVYYDRGLVVSHAHAVTRFGKVGCPLGLVHLGKRPQFLAALDAQDLSIGNSRAAVRGGRVHLLVCGTRHRLFGLGSVRAQRVVSNGLSCDNLAGGVAFGPDLMWFPRASFFLGGQHVDATLSVSPLDDLFHARLWATSLSPYGAVGAFDGVGGDVRRVFPRDAGRATLEAGGTPGDVYFRAGGSFPALHLSAEGQVRKGTAVAFAMCNHVDLGLLRHLGMLRWRPQGHADVAVVYRAGEGLTDVELAGSGCGDLHLLGERIQRFAGSMTVANQRAHVHDLTVWGPLIRAQVHGLVVSHPNAPAGLQLAWNAVSHHLGGVLRTLQVGRDPRALGRFLEDLRLSDVEGEALASGRVGGTTRNFRVRGRAVVDRGKLHGLPLVARAAFHADRNRICIDRGDLGLGGEPLATVGRVSLRGAPRLDLELSTPRMDVGTVLGFTPWNWLQATGWLDARVRLKGKPRSLTAAGHVHVQGAEVAGQDIDDLRLNLKAGRSDVVVQEFLARLGRGSVEGNGRLTLGGPLALAFKARHFPLVDVTALRHSPIARGTANLGLRVTGTTARPQVAADFDLAHLSQSTGGHVEEIRGGINWAGSRLALRHVVLRGAQSRGSARLDGWLDLGKVKGRPDLASVLDASGNVRVDFDHTDLATLLGLARVSPHHVTGRLDGSMTLTGPLRALSLGGQVTARNVVMGGIPVGTVRVDGAVDVARHESRRLTVVASGPGGDLDLAYTPGKQQFLSFDASGFELGSLRPFLPWNFPFSGRLNAHADFGGPVATPRVRGNFLVSGLRVVRATFDSFRGEISARDGVYALRHWVAARGNHHVSLDGVVPLQWNGRHLYSPTPVSVSVRVNEHDLDLLSFFIPDLLPSKGSLRGRLEIGGRYPDLRWNGALAITNGELRHATFRQPIENLQVAVRLDGDHVRIRHFTGHLGKGAFAVTGQAQLAAMQLHDMDFHFHGKDLTALVPPYVSGVFDVDGVLGGSSSHPVLQGKILAQNARVTLPLRNLGGATGNGFGSSPGEQAVQAVESILSRPADVSGTRRDGTASPVTGQGKEYASASSRENVRQVRKAPFPVPPLAVDVSVDLGTDSWLSFLGSSLRVEGRIGFHGVGARVAPKGVVRLVSGQLQIPLLPVTMRLARGRATFGGNGWVPDLVASAASNTDQYEVYVDIHGPATGPRVTFSSNPPLSQTAIRQLLVGGTVSQAASMRQNPMYTTNSLGATALINVASATVLRPVTGFIGHLFGVSEVAMEFVQSGGVQVRILKALDAARHFLLTFTSVQGGTLQANLPRQLYGFEYRFSPTQLVRVSSDNLGGLHLFYQARWRF